jgi:elongation factor G
VKAIRRATLATKITPVLCGSALRNKAVQPMLDAVIEYLPSPIDVPPVTGTHPKTGEIEERAPSDGQPFSALAFKIVADPFVGRLAYFRVYSGKIEAGQTVMNTRATGVSARPPVRMHANTLRSGIECTRASPR